MMKKWKKLMAAVCTTSMLVTMPWTGVLADEMQETYAESVVAEETVASELEVIEGSPESATNYNLSEENVTDVLAEDSELVSMEDTESVASGTCGEKLTWTLTGDKSAGYTLTINGNGAMANYGSPDYAPWHNDERYIKTITLAPYVSSIGAYAFSGCVKLTNITIPDSVTSIGAYAFFACFSLTSITIPDSVTSIGGGAFDGCDSLTSITIPDSVSFIGDDAFRECSSLTNITIPDSVSFIGEGALRDCSSLTSITIPDSVSFIGDCAFTGCSSLTSISIPDSVTEIPRWAFWCCSSLTSITIPDSVTSIGSYAFADCSSLTSITIPDSVTSIGDNAFRECSSLTNITIPDSVSFIGEGALRDCSSLTSITIPAGVTSIEGSAFNGCSSLTSITIPDSVTSIGPYAFRDCSNLTSITIPDSVTSIGGDAFRNCSSLTSITIPASVTYIGSSAFRYCDMLRSIYFAGKAPTIANDTFIEVTATAYYPEGNSTWTEDRRQSYGGTIAWVPWDGHYLLDEMTEEEHIQAYAIVDGEGAEFYYNTETLNKIDSEKGNTAKGRFIYKDEWFFGDTTKYNHDLAKMSLAAALAAFGGDENGSAKNIKALMDKLGFSYDNESIQYPTPNRYTMGYAIGSKPISEDTSLIMVASRGGGYKSEWCSNFLVGKTGDHEGFDEGSVQVGDGLSAYINKHKSELKENVKIWMVGYSRGAAVTNLAAADLDDGFIPGFGKDNVFAYCFECPQGTINKNAHSSNYSNIHNIINKIDGVTLVAMKGWDFQRYGQDYYLPFAESLRGYSSYKAEMKKEYDKILKDNGIDDFTTRTNWVQSLTSEAKGQAITLRDLTDYITYLIDRKTYVDSSLQRDAQALAYKYLGDGIQTYKVLDAVLGANLTRLNFWTRFPAMAERIDDVRLTVPSPVSNIDDLPTNFMAAHYPELCLAWMNSLDGGWETYNNKYEKIFINCPVDVVIKDDEGNIVTRIIDNKVENIENGLYAYIDDNEQKVVVVPGDGNYTAEIIANDDCDVTYTVKEYSDNDYMPESIKSYQSVEMLKEGSLKADIKPEISEYILQDDNSILVPSIEESFNNINRYLIQTECDGNGIVEGGGIFTTGEFAKVTAKPSDGSTFEGWYIGSDLITSETEYRFAVTEDVYLTAKFNDDPSVSKTNIASAAISIEESTFIYTGTQITPVITVKDSSNNILVENKDFTITYSDNVNAGTATVTVTGKGNYTGTISKSFTIAKSAPTLKFASTSLSKKTGDAAFTNSLTKTTDGIVTFKSSNTNVAIVNNTSGLVTIKGAGTATITATASEGKNYKAGSTAYSLKVEEPKPTVAGFSDVQDPSHPYYKAIYWAAERGITKGYSDGTFGINRSCTRGEMMMFLWRYAGKPAPKSVSKSPFKDVPKTHTFYKAILWGSQKGITKGYSDGTFGINRNVSRGECMMFLWRLKGKPAPKAVAKAPFPDVPKSHVFYNAVLWGYQKKITTGFTSGELKGKFGVNENCSRGQIVTFLYRAK